MAAKNFRLLQKHPVLVIIAAPFPFGLRMGTLLIPGTALLNRHAEDKAAVYTNGDIHGEIQ
jgi:hypothetical protein